MRCSSEGLSKWLIKFIGDSEVFGVIALVVPLAMEKWTILTPISAICLGLIMIPVAYIHNKRKKLKM
ncbi:MAG: DoxX family protein [Saprospiraceae bacterium]|nr:DoxX family protein [Saprospiraceae bacterium]